MDTHQPIIRQFSTDTDVQRLVSLYQAVERADQEGNEVSEQALRQGLNYPGHDPLKDRWVVVAPDGDALIGSALLRVTPGSGHSDANIFVHPEWRCRGIGTTLLARVLDRANQLGATDLQIYANLQHPASSSFLQKHAFVAQGTYTELSLTESIKLPPVIWPYGYTMRPYSELGDVAILTEAMNLSYIPLWGHNSLTEEEMASWLPELNPGSIFLVFSEKGRVIGISHAEPSPARTRKNGVATGYIDAPGVVPQHRRLDLYRALVITGVSWLREHGQSLVEMESWGDKLEVLKMYRELGFKNKRQLVCYQYNLVQGDEIGRLVSH